MMSYGMRDVFPRITLLSCLLCAACAPQYVERTADDPQDVPVRRALFAANPVGLGMAFEEGCQEPGDVFSTPDRTTARCDIVPTPESAAFLLVQFEAELEVPTLVVQKVVRQVSECFEVEMSYFAEIRAKTGNLQRVYIQNRGLDRQIDQILSTTGGQNLQDTSDATLTCAGGLAEG